MIYLSNDFISIAIMFALSLPVFTRYKGLIKAKVSYNALNVELMVDGRSNEQNED